jgi:hypothetical protein
MPPLGRPGCALPVRADTLAVALDTGRVGHSQVPPRSDSATTAVYASSPPLSVGDTAVPCTVGITGDPETHHPSPTSRQVGMPGLRPRRVGLASTTAALRQISQFTGTPKSVGRWSRIAGSCGATNRRCSKCCCSTRQAQRSLLCRLAPLVVRVPPLKVVPLPPFRLNLFNLLGGDGQDIARPLVERSANRRCFPVVSQLISPSFRTEPLVFNPALEREWCGERKGRVMFGPMLAESRPLTGQDRAGFRLWSGAQRFVQQARQSIASEHCLGPARAVALEIINRAGNLALRDARVNRRV